MNIHNRYVERHAGLNIFKNDLTQEILNPELQNYQPYGSGKAKEEYAYINSEDREIVNFLINICQTAKKPESLLFSEHASKHAVYPRVLQQIENSIKERNACLQKQEFQIGNYKAQRIKITTRDYIEDTVYKPLATIKIEKLEQEINNKVGNNQSLDHKLKILTSMFIEEEEIDAFTYYTLCLKLGAHPDNLLSRSNNLGILETIGNLTINRAKWDKESPLLDRYEEEIVLINQILQEKQGTLVTNKVVTAYFEYED